jgi:hypothetical protein
MTKRSESARRKEVPKFSATPPMRKDGFSPAHSRSHARMDVVVVFPWVPATARTRRLLRNSSFTVRAAEV